MPKQKTNRSAAKRFARAKSKMILRKKAGTSHLLTSKSRKRKRQLKKTVGVHPTDAKAVQRMVPYR